MDSVHFADLRTLSLPFADNVVVLLAQAET